MPIKYKKEDGTEIDVFTAEELEQQKKEAIDAAREEAVEEYQKEHPDRATEVAELQQKLKEAEERVQAAETAGGNEGQKERLIKERDEAREKLNKEIPELKKQLDTLSTNFTNERKANLLNKFAGTDKELRKKIEFEFDKYDPQDVTPEGIERRMSIAAQIAGVEAVPSAGDNISSAGARGEGRDTGAGVKVTENAKGIGKQLGITPEELEKHAAQKADNK